MNWFKRLVNLITQVEATPRRIDCENLKVQFKGKPFKKLVQAHLGRQDTDKLRKAAVGTVAMLPQSVQSIAVDFIDRWNERAYEQWFWQRDTSDVFSEVIEDARSLLLSHKAPTDDDTLFNMFQIVVLSYAYSASDQPKMREFMESKTPPESDSIPITAEQLMEEGRRWDERLAKASSNPKIQKVLDKYGRNPEQLKDILSILMASGAGIRGAWAVIENPKLLTQYLQMVDNGASPIQLAFKFRRYP